MYSGTSIPERVFDKVRECRFFLARMADYESAEDIENFLFCLSAFLSAFRSIAYKLYGVTENYPQKRVAHTSAGRILDWQEQRGSSCGWREGLAAVQPVYRRFHQWCMDPRRRTLRGSIRNVQASALSAAFPAERKNTSGNRCGLAIRRAPIESDWAMP